MLPGYRDLTPLGRGGYSEVYRGYQVQFDRWVAVKLLTFTLTDDRAQQRFLRECRVAGRVSGHPNIVTVYDAGLSPDGRPYMAMELYDHGSIADRLRGTGPFEVADTLRIAVALAGALESAHRAGVVHRDVKPGNVMLAAYGQPALTDFGLSIIAERQEVSTGVDAMSPHYAPPELLEGGGPSPLSDVYSLACTVYAMLAGRAPHQVPGDLDDSLGALLIRIVHEDVAPLVRPDVPPSLDVAVRAALARDPANRTPTAAGFADDLQQVQRELGLEVTQPVVLDPPAASPADDLPPPPPPPPMPSDTPADIPPPPPIPIAAPPGIDPADIPPAPPIPVAAPPGADAADIPPPPPIPVDAAPSANGPDGVPLSPDADEADGEGAFAADLADIPPPPPPPPVGSRPPGFAGEAASDDEPPSDPSFEGDPLGLPFPPPPEGPDDEPGDLPAARPPSAIPIAASPGVEAADSSFLSGDAEDRVMEDLSLPPFPDGEDGDGGDDGEWAAPQGDPTLVAGGRPPQQADGSDWTEIAPPGSTPNVRQLEIPEPPPMPPPEPPPPTWTEPAGDETMHRPPVATVPPAPPLIDPTPPKRSRALLVVLALVFLIPAIAGILIATRDGDDSASGGGGRRTTTTEATSTTEGEPATTAPADEETTTTTGAAPQPLAIADVSAPATAPDAFDACQATTTFAAGNLVDGVTSTAWRMDGDGTGQTLTVTLNDEHQIRSVGLVPGYAKTDPCDGTDRFTQNRRPSNVTWIFEDGTEVEQSLVDSPEMQTVEVDATSRTIQLRIDSVTPNPDRDFTAISELIATGT